VWARIDYLDPRARENLPTWTPPPTGDRGSSE